MKELGLKLSNSWKAKSTLSKTIILLVAIFLVWFAFCLPRPLFNQPTSTIVYDKNGHLMGAKIATDGQWRFPYHEKVPSKFGKALVYYEDEYFYFHPGFNPISMINAFNQNRKAKKIIRGGSTLTQQTIRLARQNPHRTYVEKIRELFMAVRLEISHSKKSILSYYSSYAPFGGNVVGLEAAAWRYFKTTPSNLSWAQAATLAVLPNSPALIHPGRNREELQKKRDQLLKKLFQNNVIDHLTYETSLTEDLPDKPNSMPRNAPHFTEFVHRKNPGKSTISTIELDLQNSANSVIHRHYQILRQNHIYNAAAIIMDARTREIVAYIGNTDCGSAYEEAVDMIHGQRSTGSTLKPFLFASAIDEGMILPTTLLPDVPIYYENFAPKNFDETFSGAAEADQSLVKSLNIPAVALLHDYDISKFHYLLQKLNLKGIKYPANHYGLSLILGGAESSLMELSTAYLGMVSTLLNYEDSKGKYFENEYDGIYYSEDQSKSIEKNTKNKVLSAASIYTILDILTEVKRPLEDQTWKIFEGKEKIAWKSGTSFGHKDAWAIGTNSDYVIGVWVGNADGEGRTGNTGVRTAAPIMFDLFDLVPPAKGWFSPPIKEMYLTSYCKESGKLATTACPEIVEELLPKTVLQSSSCNYHQIIHTTLDDKYRVNKNCASSGEIKSQPWFILPPKLEYYYKNRHPSYRPLPPYRDDCQESLTNMSFLYPPPNADLLIPRNIQNQSEKIVAKIAHKEPRSTIYWYVDESYIGKTSSLHEMEIHPSPGDHIITALDNGGEKIHRKISVY